MKIPGMSRESIFRLICIAKKTREANKVKKNESEQSESNDVPEEKTPKESISQ